MGFLTRLVSVEEDEVAPMLWAGLYFFLLLAAYFVIRPIRDEMGVAGGVRNLPWLFLGTLIGMLLIHPLFTTLVSRLPRRLFIPLSYGFFAVNLVFFWVLFRSLPSTEGIWVGRIFFVWASIFNLFVVSIFWSLMADLFRPAQAKRLFGFVAVGGTMGAVVGSAATAFLAARITPTNLLLLSAALLTAAILAARKLMQTAPETEKSGAADSDRPLGGGMLDGVRNLFASPYLLGIVIYMLLYTVTATFLYFQQADIVAVSFADRAARTVFFARIDLAVNTLTVSTQVFLTGRIVRRIGVALALAALPLVCVLGFAALEDFADQGKAVGVWTARCKAEQGIARRYRAAVNDVGFFHHADAEAGQVVVAVAIHAGHFSGFATDERAAGQFAALADAFDHAGGSIDIELPGGVVIEEKQRFATAHHQVIDAHCHQVDADSIVLAQLHRQLELGADPVGGGHQQRLLIAGGDCAQGTKSAKATLDFRSRGAPGYMFDAFYEGIAGINIDAGVLVTETACVGLVAHGGLSACLIGPPFYQQLRSQTINWRLWLSDFLCSC